MEPWRAVDAQNGGVEAQWRPGRSVGHLDEEEIRVGIRIQI